MWKLVVGFVLFAALSLFVIMQAGDKVDLSGEKHGADQCSFSCVESSAND